jgi:hypothetical protein
MQLGRMQSSGRACGRLGPRQLGARPAAPLPNHARSPCASVAAAASAVGGAELAERLAVKAERNVPGMSAFLDSLKWDKNSLVAVIVQVRAAA